MSRLDPTDEKLRVAQTEFRRWATALMEGENGLPELRLVEMFGISRNGFRSALDEGRDWIKGQRSPYWPWVERRERLLSMDAAKIIRRTDTFRKVGDKVGLKTLAVSQSWWANEGFDGLGVEVRGDGEVVEVNVTAQVDGVSDDAVDTVVDDATGDGDVGEALAAAADEVFGTERSVPADADTSADEDLVERTLLKKGRRRELDPDLTAAEVDATAQDGDAAEVDESAQADEATDGDVAVAETEDSDVEDPLGPREEWIADGFSITRTREFGEDLIIDVGAEGKEKAEESLLRIRPGRVGVTTLQSFENVLESMGEGHVYSLEIVSVNGDTELLVRTTYPERVAQHIFSHYPGCVIERVFREDDPMVMREGETGYRHVLRPVGDEWLPFQVYGEQQVRDGGDPLIDVLGGVMGVDLRAGERLVSRVVLRQQPHDWSESWRARGMSGTGGENQLVAERERRRLMEEDNERRKRDSSRQGDPKYEGSGADDYIVPFIVLGLCAALAWFLYQLWEEDKIFQFWAYGVGAIFGITILALGAWKMGMFKGKKGEEAKYYDPEQVSVRISGSAFQVEVHTLAFLGGGGTNARNRATQLLSTMNGVYRGFDNPLGCRFDVESMRELRHEEEGAALPRVKDRWDILPEQLLGFSVERRRYGMFGKMPPVGVIGVKEIVAFWHIPGEGVELPSLKRAQSKLLVPPSSVLEGGALVGTSREFDGGLRGVFFPFEVMNRHQLYVARTRQGKSTLMCHVASEKLAAKARGENPDALVVVDPHSDLIHDILERVPAELEGRVFLLDLGGINRRVGLNLLDTRVFDDRDAAVEAVIDVAKGIWENWGNRMEIILSYTLKAMYEANRKLRKEGQLTMLDTTAMLTNEKFRVQVLSKVDDPFILEWWETSHAGWVEEYGKEAIAPVLTRMANYSGNKTVRAILGQRSCTLNVREVIERGDVLLVNTNQSAVGTEVASLVGASILKLVDTFVRKQGEIRENETIERRRVTLIVDEMQSIQGVDFQSMLAEVGKYGGSLILATQSLSRLDELAMTMRDSIMANIGVLVCFQVNAVDAARLLPELRSEYLTEADITGLPQHNSYVRVAPGGEVQAPFTMQVLPPVSEDGVVEGIVAGGSYAYTRDGDEVDSELASAVEQRVRGFRQQILEDVKGLKVDEEKVGEDGVSDIMLEDLGKAEKRTRRRKRKR